MFAIVAVGVFPAALDLFIVNIAFPAIQRDFSGSSVSDVSWVLNVYAIVFAALLVSAGKLGDILGRRRVFVAGLLAFGLGSALSAAAPSLELLIAARVIQGPPPPSPPPRWGSCCRPSARPRVLRQRPTPALAFRRASARRTCPHSIRAEGRTRRLLPLREQEPAPKRVSLLLRTRSESMRIESRGAARRAKRKW